MKHLSDLLSARGEAGCLQIVQVPLSRQEANHLFRVYQSSPFQTPIRKHCHPLCVAKKAPQLPFASCACRSDLGRAGRRARPYPYGPKQLPPCRSSPYQHRIVLNTAQQFQRNPCAPIASARVPRVKCTIFYCEMYCPLVVDGKNCPYFGKRRLKATVSPAPIARNRGLRDGGLARRFGLPKRRRRESNRTVLQMSPRVRRDGAPAASPRRHTSLNAPALRLDTPVRVIWSPASSIISVLPLTTEICALA